MVVNLKIDKRVYWFGAWSQEFKKLNNKANAREDGEGE